MAYQNLPYLEPLEKLTPCKFPLALEDHEKNSTELKNKIISMQFLIHWKYYDHVMLL